MFERNKMENNSKIIPFIPSVGGTGKSVKLFPFAIIVETPQRFTYSLKSF